jgi:hypothetical protein
MEAGELVRAEMAAPDRDVPPISADDVLDAHRLLAGFRGDVHQLMAHFGGEAR